MDEQHAHQAGFERFLEILTQRIAAGWPGGTEGEVMRGFRVYLEHGQRISSTRSPPDRPEGEPGRDGISILPRRK